MNKQIKIPEIVLFSRLFTSDLKAIIERLSSLSKGETSIVLPEVERKDEFGSVNNGYAYSGTLC